MFVELETEKERGREKSGKVGLLRIAFAFGVRIPFFGQTFAFTKSMCMQKLVMQQHAM